MLRVADLAPGMGGMALGFRKAGHQVVFLTEHDAHARAVLHANFPSIPLVAKLAEVDPAAITHPDVVCLSHPVLMAEATRIVGVLRPRALVAEWPSGDVPELRALGYESWNARLDTYNFGLPQRRARVFVVMFRSDVRAPFLSFPFTTTTGRGGVLASILAPTPGLELLLGVDALEWMRKHGESNLGRGFRFKYKVHSPAEISPALSARYHKDGYDLLVNSGEGPRRLSILECKRLMGFPDDWQMPVSRTQAYRLLGAATCPPVAASLAADVQLWLER